MKKVSICIGCYNEEGNINELYDRLTAVMSTMPDYDYEIIFEDNASKDRTQEILRKIASEDRRVKLIFNTRDFGVARSGRNCVYNASGDVVVSITADLQDPPEMIPEMLKYWEKGYLLVLGKKVASKENPIKYALRNLYYTIIKQCSETPQLFQYAGFGAVDRKVYEQIRACDERTMSFRHLIPEFGYEYKSIPYTQERRKSGRSSYNLWKCFDFSITSLVSTSKLPIRMATIAGSIGIFVFGIYAVILAVLSLWDPCDSAIKEKRRNVFGLLLSMIQIFVTGMVGEYVLEVVEKNRKRPLVVEKERINFDEK